MADRDQNVIILFDEVVNLVLRYLGIRSNNCRWGWGVVVGRGKELKPVH